MHGQSAAIVACSPGANAALGLCVLSEDETEHDVQAAHGEEEKRGDEREFANVVREDRCPDAKRAIRIRGSVPVAQQDGKNEALTVPGRSRGGRGQTATRGRGKSGQRRPSATRSRIRGGRPAER